MGDAYETTLLAEFEKQFKNLETDIENSLLEVSDNLKQYYTKAKQAFDDNDPLGTAYGEHRRKSIINEKLREAMHGTDMQKKKLAQEYILRNNLTAEDYDKFTFHKTQLNTLKKLLIEALIQNDITIHDNLVTDIFVVDTQLNNTYDDAVAVLLNGYDKLRSHFLNFDSPTLANVFKVMDSAVQDVHSDSNTKSKAYFQMFKSLMILTVLAREAGQGGIVHKKKMKTDTNSIHKYNEIQKNRKHAIVGIKIIDKKRGGLDRKRTILYIILFLLLVALIIFPYLDINLPTWVYGGIGLVVLCEII